MSDIPRLIDLRSDTVTKPTAAMRAVMAQAPVGDDVYSEDPTINLLQERIADLLGKQAALFVPSGTMSNQIALRVHTTPGDEIICEENCHIFTWEAGAPAALSGVSCRTVLGDFGVLDLAQLKDKVRPTNEHYAQTKLVTLENTHNRGGGRVYPLEKIWPISRWANANGLAMHLDGARLWNAHIVTKEPLHKLAEPFDTVSICFSKGLGAPVGSALVGPSEFIAKARRIRKLFGGAIRQGGILAAAALYAIDHHVERLAEDHQNAQLIAEAVRDIPGLRLDPPFVETNLVWFEADPEIYSPRAIIDRLKQRGILMSILGTNMLRACTHLDVSKADAEFVADQLRIVCRELPKPEKSAPVEFD